MSKLIDSFPDWYDANNGAIFNTMSGVQGAVEEFPWLENAAILDAEYIGNHSGEKTVSPLVDRFIAHNSGDLELTENQRIVLASILLNKFRNKWLRLQAVEESEYNPIENYNMEEEETPDISRKHRASNDFAITDEKAINRDVTTTESATNDFEITDEKKINRDIITTETATDDFEITDEKRVNTDVSVETNTNTDSSIYGFNANTPTPANEAEGNSTVHTTGSDTNNKETNTHSQVGGKEVRETADDTKNVEVVTHGQTGGIQTHEVADGDDNTETITHTQVGYTEDTETGKRELKRSGNIGVTTSQQMLESEIALWDWNFVNSIFDDIDTVLTINIYV